MITALKPLEPEAAKEEFESQENPAVDRCIEAWINEYQSMLKKKKSQDIAFAKANAAYGRAMPRLVGNENIRNYVACVGYGMLTSIFIDAQGTRLLYAAQVAFNIAPPRTKKPKKAAESCPKPLSFSTLAPNCLPTPLDRPPLITNNLAR